MCGAGNRSKASFAIGQHAIQQTKFRMNKYMYNYTSVYNFTCVFVYTSYTIKFIDNRKSSQKCSSHLRLRCCYFWNISTILISNAICVYVKKTDHTFSKLFLHPTLAFPGKWFKELFLCQISLRQHFSRELQFQRVWSRQILHKFSLCAPNVRPSVCVKTLFSHLPLCQIFMKDAMNLMPVKMQ